VDPLDELFRFHDMAYDSPSTLVRAEGDLALIQGIEELSLGSLSPEQSLYADPRSCSASSNWCWSTAIRSC
jgi:hypothetical protein